VRRILAPLVLGACLLSCDALEGPSSARPDDRLTVHAVQVSTPSAARIAYVTSVAAAHDRADAASSDAARTRALREGLALPVPADLMEADVLRLELGTALCETLARQPQGIPAALGVLAPMLRPTKSLPLDRVTARALVTLGDTARDSGDDALAVASYARSIRIMSMLREELMP
jgi:hypothetical protein